MYDRILLLNQTYNIDEYMYWWSETKAQKHKKVLADGNVAVVYILNSLKFKLEYNGTEGKIWLGLPMCSW
jgi:hypothetical protein